MKLTEQKLLVNLLQLSLAGELVIVNFVDTSAEHAKLVMRRDT
jgi:hypothetical protein